MNNRSTRAPSRRPYTRHPQAGAWAEGQRLGIKTRPRLQFFGDADRLLVRCLAGEVEAEFRILQLLSRLPAHARLSRVQALLRGAKSGAGDLQVRIVDFLAQALRLEAEAAS